jgi:Fe-Mn family superoxide dismutase
MTFTLPSLPYAYNALEPYIDEQTMRIHHTKHHQAYVDKLNAAIALHPEFAKKSAEELIKNIKILPLGIQAAVKNNGGGHINHSFFWQILKKGVAPKGEILDAINSRFASFDNFKSLFKEASTGLFGSGWVWLVVNPKTKQLEITKTPNQDNPIAEGKIPILGIDLWEHAYYLKYQNKRADYVDAFFNVINWNRVNEFFVKA